MTAEWLKQVFAADDAAKAEHEAFMRKLERDRERVEQRKLGPSLEELQTMAQEHERMMIRMESDPAYIRCVREERQRAIERLRWQCDVETEPEERKRLYTKMVRMQKEYAQEMTRCFTQQACECGGSCKKCSGGE
jgi:hypothetical protein